MKITRFLKQNLQNCENFKVLYLAPKMSKSLEMFTTFNLYTYKQSVLIFC